MPAFITKYIITKLPKKSVIRKSLSLVYHEFTIFDKGNRVSQHNTFIIRNITIDCFAC